MTPIVPYLTVSNAPEAIAFYKKAFDAKENARMPEENGKRIMHADLTIHGGSVFIMDEFPEYGGAPHPTEERKMGALSLPWLSTKRAQNTNAAAEDSTTASELANLLKDSGGRREARTRALRVRTRRESGGNAQRDKG